MNLLAQETSPYLQQHASNPVDWYPWGPTALAAARESGKPILLSIGYSACHWCHVMAHESFEDEDTAKIMNELFINIKVDREERPDIDKIYQTSQYLLNERSGGWPLTMFLTPDNQTPFFGGTYFPDQARHGLPAFKDLLLHVARVFREKHDAIQQQNNSMRQALKKIYSTQDAHQTIDDSIFQRARDELIQSFDKNFGGFGKAPKFPHPTNIERLMRHHALHTHQMDHEGLHAVTLTLDKMALGGLFDQIGGGFYRYSVDDYWTIPHFEKMLYDNAALLTLYCQAYAMTGNSLFYRTAVLTADWVIRDMQSANGAFYSSIDADSEGMEGKYYVWSPDQIKNLLSLDEWTFAERLFGLDGPPNFESHYHLNAVNSILETRPNSGLFDHHAEQMLSSISTKLLKQREQRVAPATDDKILTSWNGLMIKAMTIAGRVLNRPDYLESAERALQFIYSHLWDKQRLVATYKDGHAHLNAYLDDYAFMLDAVFEHLQSRWDTQILTFACELADTIMDQFEDPVHGGFYFTSNDHETLLQRPRVSSDEATPSGYGIAAVALARLGYLLGETRYIHTAERAIDSSSTNITNMPIAHATLLTAYEEQIQPPQIIIIRGKQDDSCRWQQLAQRGYHPGRLVFTIPGDSLSLPKSVAEKKADASHAAIAYFCVGTTCHPPIVEEKEFNRLLRGA